MNPEFRQTLAHISRNIESANEAAQENIYTFTQLYVDPCLDGLKSCVHECTAPCFPTREDQLRRRRGRSRGRAEYNFDFYDDWDEEENSAGGGLTWRNDELDGLLAGRTAQQPQRRRAMSYGARRRRDDVESDPTVIPKSSYLGFLERLPFKFGSTGIRYKPSAANLEENPGGLRIRDVEAAEPLLNGAEQHSHQKGHSRQRSGTSESRSTLTSHSSRGDLIMSDEDEDAVPIDDEFATVILARHLTGQSGLEEHGNGKQRRLLSKSRISSRTVSTRSDQSSKSSHLENKKISEVDQDFTTELRGRSDQSELQTMADLKEEEEELRQKEELEIVQKREAAQKLAQSIGLSTEMKSPESAVQSDQSGTKQLKSPTRYNPNSSYFTINSPVSPTSETEPFPKLDAPRSPESSKSVKDGTSDQPP